MMDYDKSLVVGDFVMCNLDEYFRSKIFKIHKIMPREKMEPLVLLQLYANIQFPDILIDKCGLVDRDPLSIFWCSKLSNDSINSFLEKFKKVAEITSK